MHVSARCEIRVPGKKSSGDERFDGMNAVARHADVVAVFVDSEA